MNPLPGLSATDLTQWVLLLALLALAPFVLAMVTSFVKIVVVTSVLRTALGVQQVPPGIVVTGLAMLLTAHVMWPVGMQIADRYQAQAPRAGGGLDFGAMHHAIAAPLGAFLSRHAAPQNVALFTNLKQRLAVAPGAELPADDPPATPPCPDDLVHLITVIAPAFVLTELTEAFQIGFLIFIPFLIVDLCVSNTLMALGLQYLQPTLVSLPLKLLLFVLVDGWRLILEGVLLGYTEG